MCGITGYLNFGNGRSPDHIQSTIARMNAAVAHRGPNNRGQWADPNNFCHLGHTRLSILDLSPAGHQPMSSGSQRFVITFNGEIYNFRHLKKVLENKGAVFHTGTDTEVILAGYEMFGFSFFRFMDGMFALALYDRTNGTLTLVRDRAGEKPLYYAFGSDFFVFGSEMRALLEVNELSVSLSEEGLAQYFTLRYVLDPDTILSPIRKLEPGTLMQVSRTGHIHQERYFFFDINQDEEVPAQDLETYADKVEEALTDSITDRLNSDVPLGMFLSSGVDSSLACAILTKKMGRQVKTFTVGFEGDAGSEHEPARRIANILGTEHRDYIFGSADFDRVCQDIGKLMDEPNGDRSCVPTYLLAEFTRAHVTVAISGDAGDELFGGYGRYPAFATAYDKDPNMHPAAMVKSYIEQGLPVSPPDSVQKAFPQGYNSVLSLYFRYAPLFMHLQRPAIHPLRQFDFLTYLPGAVLAKVDRMSMRHALEVRTPFLSPRMLDLSSRASAGLCWSGNVQKVALRHLLARYLPQEHVQAPKKGFGMPGSVFLNNKARVEQELHGSYAILAETRFFKERPAALQHLFSGITANTNSIWATIVLAKWLQTVGKPL